jgi:predicted enzyme related to lactoylglutathione lyase
VPNSWLTYFAVDDLDASVAKVTELGGSVMMPSMEVEGVGRFAVVADNHGAVFAIIKMANPES